MGPSYIRWPTAEERATIKRSFQDKYGYPGVVGCIDGTHTYITAPLEDQQAYNNRHHSHSILTQAVVDHTYLVRDLYVGEAGSLHDSRVFRRSPLSRNLLENNDMLSEDEHILGDSAYILTDRVVTPYTDNGLLTEAQRLHNYIFSSCRCTVERGFCLCKGRFRRLKLMESHSIDIAVDHITACFVLHNFIILAGEPMDAPDVNLGAGEPMNPPEGIADIVGEGNGNVQNNIALGDDYPNVAAEPDHPLLAEARIAGEEKRDAIAARLFLARRRN